MDENTKEENKEYYNLIKKIFKWITLSIIMGIPIGIIVGLFNRILSAVNSYRKEHEYLIYLLPIAGILITFMYLKAKRNAYSGENLLKSEVQSAAKDIPFTAVALGSVFQGGRGNPTFFVGATLGSFVSKFINLPLTSVSALGMIGLFCSATSLPITSIVMALEYFGGEEMLAIIIVMIISYVISGFYDILVKKKLPKEKIKLFEGVVHKNK